MTYKNKNQKGFTALEVLISLGVLTLVIAGALQVMGPWIDFKTKIESEVIVDNVVKGVKNMYEINAWNIDNTSLPDAIEIRPESGLQLAGIVRVNGTSKSFGGRECPDLSAEFAKMRAYMPSSDINGKDGAGNNLCFFIYQNQPLPYKGVRLVSKSFVIASAGKDGILETNFNVATPGQIVPVGDDIFKYVDGTSIHKKIIDDLIVKVDKVANFYATYFTVRFSANPAREVNRYYFCDGTLARDGTTQVSPNFNSFDRTGGILAVACSNGSPNMGSGIDKYPNTLAGRLKLPPDTYTGGYYRGTDPEEGVISVATNNEVITYINAQGVSSTIRPRTPASSTGLQPPFTAIVFTRLPANGLYARTVTGTY